MCSSYKTKLQYQKYLAESYFITLGRVVNMQFVIILSESCFPSFGHYLTALCSLMHVCMSSASHCANAILLLKTSKTLLSLVTGVGLPWTSFNVVIRQFGNTVCHLDLLIDLVLNVYVGCTCMDICTV